MSCRLPMHEQLLLCTHSTYLMFLKCQQSKLPLTPPPLQKQFQWQPTNLPFFRAFLGELCKVHRSPWVLLFVFFTACLDKESIRGSLSSGLVWILYHGCNVSGMDEGEKNTSWVTVKFYLVNGKTTCELAAPCDRAPRACASHQNYLNCGGKIATQTSQAQASIYTVHIHRQTSAALDGLPDKGVLRL